MVRSFQKGASSSTVNTTRPRRGDTGVWPCTLDACTKVFAREADLKRHQRTTKTHLVPGSSVGSPCPLCDATFTRTDAMRRHLKSRHNGKTPETLHLPDVPSTSANSNRRGCSPSEASEFSASDGEHHQEQAHSASSSRAQSAAPPYHDNTHHAPPPPNNLSPAILYQAAMSYEIRHALTLSTSPTSSLAGTQASTTSALDPESGDSRRVGYNQPPDHEPFAQYPGQSYAYQNHHTPYVGLPHPHPHPQHYTSGGGTGPLFHNGTYLAGRNGGGPPSYAPQEWGPGPEPDAGSPDSVKLEDVDVAIPADRRGRGRDADHSPRSPFAPPERLPSGLAALAMHAARIRPMSPLPNVKQAGKTKSELESALGPSYAR